ncbi:NUDIX domain-containing protein [Streptomyces sp. SR-10]|uniref:NUDIX domain-containing protein n=1 Tax=Streptomyces sp. SR-10 TaxID=3416442 RepID=UPI003CEE8535
MTTVGVGVVVRDAEGRVLAGWRVKDPARPCWSLPGGHMEPGESPAAAALRELREETGLVGVDARPFVMIVDEWQGGTRVTTGVHVRLAAAGQPALTEPEVFDRWEWLDDPRDPLFTASGHVLDAWYGRPLSTGAVARHGLGGGGGLAGLGRVDGR